MIGQGNMTFADESILALMVQNESESWRERASDERKISMPVKLNRSVAESEVLRGSAAVIYQY